MDETKELLTKQIETEIRNLSVVSGEEKSEAIDEVSKLYRLKIEETKAEAEAKAREVELNDQKKDRWISHGITAAGTILTFGFNWVWMRRVLKFEETGAFSSNAFRWLQNGIKHLKR